MINFEPTFDLDLGAYAKIAFHLFFIEFEVSVDLIPYRFRPFAFSFAIDPYHPRRYCFGFDYFTKGVALEIFYSQNVRECNFGAFGYFVGDWEDCRWQKYNPALPLFEI